MEFPDRSPNSSPNSLREKIRSSMYLSCCFGAGDEERPPSLLRSSTSWIRSKAQELPPLVAGMNRNNTRRHHGGGPFRYDPLSYAQNFDEGPDYDEEPEAVSVGEFRYRNFSVRHPSTSPPAAPAVEVS